MPLISSRIEESFNTSEGISETLLSSILNFNLNCEANQKVIVNLINKHLATAKHRREGFEFISLLISNCCSSVIVENALSWINHCCVKYSNDTLKEIKLKVAGKIIEAVHEESDFNKKFVSEHLPKIFENCITTSYVNLYECVTALKTLTICMTYYPSWFGTHKQKIEKFVLVFLDSDNEELVQNAGRAFLCLQQVGGAGVNGQNHKQNFTLNFHKLCDTVQKLYDNFFEAESEIFHTEINNETFEFENSATNSLTTCCYINFRRIVNILRFIEAMIRFKFPVAKEISPRKLLDLITRGMSIHKCISGENLHSLETVQFSLLLVQIQTRLLRLLRLFIVWCQNNILPYSYEVSKVIVNSIKTSQNCSCFQIESVYNESAYRALSEWLTISKSSLHPQFQEQVLLSILKDITPLRDQITLTIADAISGNKSQKAKRKAITNRIISSGNPSITESSTGSEKLNEMRTCMFALTAAKQMLESTRLNVKPALIKDLFKSVFDSLKSIQCAKAVRPYANRSCQVKLYEVLVAFYYQTTLSTLPPIQTTLDILNRGVNDNNQLVSVICRNGVRTLEVLCQPICPSLYLQRNEYREEDDNILEDSREEDEILEDVEQVQDTEPTRKRNTQEIADYIFDETTVESLQDESIQPTVRSISIEESDIISVDDTESVITVRNEEPNTNTGNNLSDSVTISGPSNESLIVDEDNSSEVSENVQNKLNQSIDSLTETLPENTFESNIELNIDETTEKNTEHNSNIKDIESEKEKLEIIVDNNKKSPYNNFFSIEDSNKLVEEYRKESELSVNLDEPEPKRLKIDIEKEDMQEENPDADVNIMDLNDDSFVDQVKEY